MSRRNSRQEKQVRRLRKALRRTPPAYIDLIDWLKDRGYADTTGKAKEIILAKRVKSESHVLGIDKMPAMKDGKVQEIDVVSPRVPAKLRGSIVVLNEDA